MSEDEIPLEGGNTSIGVVRVGDTVRKNMTKNSPTTHKLLKHLESKGFSHCPKHLGIDARSREILSFIEGETGIPPYIWISDQCLIDTAEILRQYHDATLDFPHSSDDSWAFSYHDTQHIEVICHNDFAPYNMIYQKNLPIAVIDFDLAGLAPRIRDVAYSAYWNVPLSVSDAKMSEHAINDLAGGSKRLKVFCEAYGTELNEDLLDMIAEVLSHMGSEEKAIEMIGKVAATCLKDGGHFDHWDNELSAFQKHRIDIVSSISGKSERQ